MKKILKISLFIVILLAGIANIANANATDINLTIRSGNTIIFSDTVPLPEAGTVELNTHSLDADSVLSIDNSGSGEHFINVALVENGAGLDVNMFADIFTDVNSDIIII